MGQLASFGPASHLHRSQGDTKFVFQGVHESINFGPAQEPWKEGEPRINKMVWIGKGLDREALREVQ